MACTDTVWCESCAVRLDSKCMTAQRKLVCQCHPCQVTQWNYWNNCGNSALQKTEEAKKVKREGDRNGGEKQGWTDRQSPDGECRSQGIFPIMMFPLTTGTWSCWKPSFFSIRSVSSIPAHANVVFSNSGNSNTRRKCEEGECEELKSLLLLSRNSEWWKRFILSEVGLFDFDRFLYLICCCCRATTWMSNFPRRKYIFFRPFRHHTNAFCNRCNVYQVNHLSLAC